MAILAEIRFHNLPNCFGYLSDNATAFVETNSFGIFHCTGVNNKTSKCLPLQLFASKPPFHYVHLSKEFIEAQGYRLGDQVMLKTIPNVPLCQWLEVMPETYDDWNMIENTSYVIEDIFLQQIRVIQPNMSFVLSLSEHVTVKVRVVDVQPKSTGCGAVLVTNSTPVLVAPINPHDNSFIEPRVQEPTDRADESLEVTVVDPLTNFVWSGSESTKFLRISAKAHFPPTLSRFMHRTVITRGDDINYTQKQLVELSGGELLDNQFAVLITLPFKMPCDHEFYELWHQLQNETQNSCCISPDLQSLGAHKFTRIKCRVLRKSGVCKIKSLLYECSIEIGQTQFNEALQNYCQEIPFYRPVVVPLSGLTVLLSYGNEGAFQATIYPVDLGRDLCGYFWPDEIPDVCINDDTASTKRRNDVNEVKKPPRNYAIEERKMLDLSFQKKIVQSLSDELNARLKGQCSGHILIAGDAFVGKTTVTKLVADELLRRSQVFSSYIDCNEFKGKQPDSIIQTLEIRLTLLSLRAPSLLILDNFAFLNITIEDDERRRFVNKIYSKITHLIQTYGICVIMTAPHVNSLPDCLTTFQGARFFATVVSVPSLGKDDYAEVISQRFPHSAVDIPREMEQLNLGETLKLCDRLQLISGESKLTQNDWISAIESFPVCGRQFEEHSDEYEISFSDVGGYESIKENLREIFIWPSLYPKLFGSIGIRLGSGVMLYGPSGCGKTLLMKSMAKETGLNVIYVNGPGSILSKYIGASEENVRRLFERARQSKPSLIVFDEFDALAPKRGHDNTGVTDRIVNQFLTEMDGVDNSMDGIFVMAATNRIDLIDVALLRPGRFEHKLFVDYPNQSERLTVLKKHCENIELESEEALEEIAECTERWSNAELRGIIVNALFESERENGESSFISNDSLRTAFKTANSERRPNQPKREIPKYRTTLA